MFVKYFNKTKQHLLLIPAIQIRFRYKRTTAYYYDNEGERREETLDTVLKNLE